MQRWGKRIVLGLLIALVAAQFLPVNRDNPAIDPGKTLYSAQAVPADVRGAIDRSCKDCHSNETVWPWYSYVAPFSWLVAHDVHDGRGELNLSEWGSYTDKRKGRKLLEICEQLRSGEMPDWKYTLIHRTARLTQEESTGLCAWAETTRKSFATEGDGAKSPDTGAVH